MQRLAYLEARERRDRDRLPSKIEMPVSLSHQSVATVID
jgi:hypothetical protein